MIVDGNHIANKILETLAVSIGIRLQAPTLAVICSAPNFETQKFLAVKRRKAEAVGIKVNVIELPETVTLDTCIDAIRTAAETSDGIVVQLPFPTHIDRAALIAAIPHTHDVDAFLLDDPKVPPPVIGAMQEVLTAANSTVEGKHAVVIGEGLLVGKPAARWLKRAGARVDVVTHEVTDLPARTQAADIIVLGAGVPALLQPYMISTGVVILDAGTSEDAGELRGDADPACAEKASVFTPVPGGIGPITVAVLLKNLYTLSSREG